MSLSIKSKGPHVRCFPSSIISMTFSTSVCPTHSSLMTLKLAVSIPGPLHFLFPLLEMRHGALLNEVFSDLLSSFVKGKELYQKNLKEDVKNDRRLYYLTEIVILYQSILGRKSQRNPRLHSLNCKPGDNHTGTQGAMFPLFTGETKWKTEKGFREYFFFFYCFPLETPLLLPLLVKSSCSLGLILFLRAVGAGPCF